MNPNAELSEADFTTIWFEVRENQIQYFSRDEVEYYYKKNDGDLKATVYELLLIKAEDSTISVSGLSTRDTSSYFRKLASRYRTYHSGVLTSE